MTRKNVVYAILAVLSLVAFLIIVETERVVFTYYRLVNGDELVVGESRISVGDKVAIFSENDDGITFLIRRGRKSGEIVALYHGAEDKSPLKAIFRGSEKLIREYSSIPGCSVFEIGDEGFSKFVFFVGRKEYMLEVEGAHGDAGVVTDFCNNLTDR